jgi:L-ribulose-5-phosphate 3-epimerase
MKNRIGFMQGRLVNQVDGKIQAFPVDTWCDEFPIAQRIGLNLLEWTLDDNQLKNNPFCTVLGQAKINDLSKKFSISVDSVTGDCFMQSPFWKSKDGYQTNLLTKLDLVLESSALLNVKFVVIPLVDNGSLENAEQRDDLHKVLTNRIEMMRQCGLCIAFESDMSPSNLRDFISDYPSDCFGINYDIGNSASSGFDPETEMQAYASRIINVHVKDRKLGGTTVPLGSGVAKFREVFIGLKEIQYAGNFILQTARAIDANHEQELIQNLSLTKELLGKYFES